MLRMILEAATPEEAIVSVHGRISGADVALLEDELQARLRETTRLILDLGEVVFVDRSGCELLHRRARGGLILRGGSPFLRALLAGAGLTLP